MYFDGMFAPVGVIVDDEAGGIGVERGALGFGVKGHRAERGTP